MNGRTATRYLYWVGEKLEAGDELTAEEQELYKIAKAASLSLVKKYMRLGPEDWKYVPGKPFK